MHRRVSIIAFSLVAALTACDRLPQSHRLTPELTGRLMRSGIPVSGATILVVRRPDIDSPERACRDDLTSTRTDNAGTFVARAFRTWMHAEVVEEAERSGEQFQVCVRPRGAAEYQLMFRATAHRWDTMILECDLDREWLAPDRYDSAGQCLVTRVGVEGQPIAQRPTRPAALTCDTSTTLLEANRIGPLKVWGNIDELARLCRKPRDTMVVDHAFMDAGQEMPMRVLNIAGEPVMFHKMSDLVHYMMVTSPVFRTAEGFGVGTPAARLLEKPDLKLAFNPETMEHFYFAWHGAECGIGYAILPPPGFRGRPGGMVPPGEMRDWPATMSVSRVYVGHCPSRHWLRAFDEAER